MSASREKKKRQELGQAGMLPSQKKAAEEKKKKQKNLLIGCIVAVLILAAAVYSLFSLVIVPNRAPKAEALTVGSHDLTAAELNYYYIDTIYSFCNNYSSYLSYFLDTSKPLNEQYYDEDNQQTWADYFLENAITTAKNTYAVYDEAVANGYKLSEDGEKTLADNLDSLETQVKDAGYSSLNQYFTSVYGRGSGRSGYEAYQRVQLTASEYAQSYEDGLTYTDEQLQAKYDESPNEYTNITYRSFYLPASNYKPAETEDATDEASTDTSAETDTAEEAAEDTDESADSTDASAEDTDESTDSTEETDASADTEEDDAQYLAMAEADAKAMAEASKGDETVYTEQAKELASESTKSSYDDPDYTLKNNVAYSSVPTACVDWLYDSARKDGDTTVISDDNGCYVLYFIATDKNDYNTVNVRHILLAPEKDLDSDNDGTNDASSDEAKANAKQKAEDVLAEWKNGAATEDSFAELADTYSSDSAEGGLLEDVYHNQMVQPFNDWCFDASRQPGDVDIVETEYGYHVIYFIGEGDTYRDVLVRNALRSDDYQTWYTGLTEEYNVERHEDGIANLKMDMVLSTSAAG